MKNITISESIKYIGANDKTLDIFESQYKIPNGVSYNSYLILDEKVAIMDTVDRRASDEWIANLQNCLNGRTPDYLIISHLEPDHAYNIQNVALKYPEMKLIGNAKTFAMLPQFFDIDISDRMVVVKEGDTVNLGKHSLTFVMAPMVHWPEVMVSYESTEKILFSADGFGKFGALDVEEDWVDEARRYYINIVGKFGAAVQALLKKASTLEINTICPLHGPILKENLGFYLDKYNTWSSYTPESNGTVIAYGSIHGNTAKAAKLMADILKEKYNEEVVLIDLSRDDMSSAISNSFKYDKLIIAAATYDSGLFPPVEDFLSRLKHKSYQNRKVGIIENGSWAPLAAKCIKEDLSKMKNISICDTCITIKSTVKEDNIESMRVLADEIMK